MRMLALVIATVPAIVSGAAQAASADARLERTLRMLALPERLEQLCDYTAMTAIRKEHKDFRPDRAVANAMHEPKASGHSLEATGAAVRSKKKWYALTYSCKADDEHMKVQSFSYRIGGEIPPDKWASFNLYD